MKGKKNHFEGKVEVKMVMCPFTCYKGLGEEIGWARGKIFYKCRKCGEQWSLENVQSDV